MFKTFSDQAYAEALEYCKQQAPFIRARVANGDAASANLWGAYLCALPGKASVGAVSWFIAKCRAYQKEHGHA